MKLWCWMFHQGFREGVYGAPPAGLAFGLTWHGTRCTRCKRYWPI